MGDIRQSGRAPTITEAVGYGESILKEWFGAGETRFTNLRFSESLHKSHGAQVGKLYRSVIEVLIAKGKIELTFKAPTLRDEILRNTGENANQLYDRLKRFSDVYRILGTILDPLNLGPTENAKLQPDNTQPATGAVTQVPPPPKKVEGTVLQGVFVYKENRAEHIEPAPWRLLEFMEDIEEADSEEAYHYAIDDKEKDSTPRAINTMVSKANAALTAVTYPRVLTKVKGVRKIMWT